MRDPRSGEVRYVCVCKVTGYPIVCAVEVVVQSAVFDKHAGGTITQRVRTGMCAALKSWVKQLPAADRDEIADSCARSFNIGDLAEVIGGGFDDRPKTPPEPADLEYHLLRSGFRAVEIHSFAASDEDDTWDHDDVLYRF